MAATFLMNTSAEILKTRKTAAFWLTIIGAFFIPFVLTLTYLFRPDVFGPMYAKQPWLAHIARSWEAAAAFLIPMYVILVTSLMVQIEYRNNTWKQVYASPRSYADIYFSKMLVIQLMILACFLLYNVGILSSAYIAELVHPSVYKFDEVSIPVERMWTITSKLYISTLAITAIQYWVSLRVKNYIAPLGIGLALLIVGLMAIQWDKIIYYPFAYTALSYFKNIDEPTKGIQNLEFYSLTWFAVVLMLGFWDTVKRKERG